MGLDERAPPVGEIDPVGDGDVAAVHARLAHDGRAECRPDAVGELAIQRHTLMRARHDEGRPRRPAVDEHVLDAPHAADLLTRRSSSGHDSSTCRSTTSSTIVTLRNSLALRSSGSEAMANEEPAGAGDGRG